MKVKATVTPKALKASNAGPCARSARAVTNAKCGVAFALYQLRDDRMKRAGLKAVSETDIHAGLATAAGALERHQNGLSSDDLLLKTLKPIRSEIVTLRNLFKYDGKRKIGRTEAVAIYGTLEKVHAKLDQVLDGIERVCQG